MLDQSLICQYIAIDTIYNEDVIKYIYYKQTYPGPIYQATWNNQTPDI